ncbi:hypothetical protein CDAR_523631 [Caerostris darwini]|uniref:Uncharacterized protein n=1 Tax=Caerostris darwini TaxID=1538125 RepID=A0AAV4UV81_9ARAC|nr:hypothetical protein CDAR_523631 [Caerostris darwini]
MTTKVSGTLSVRNVFLALQQSRNRIIRKWGAEEIRTKSSKQFRLKNSCPESNPPLLKMKCFSFGETGDENSSCSFGAETEVGRYINGREMFPENHYV